MQKKKEKTKREDKQGGRIKEKKKCSIKEVLKKKKG